MHFCHLAKFKIKPTNAFFIFFSFSTNHIVWVCVVLPNNRLSLGYLFPKQFYFVSFLLSVIVSQSTLRRGLAFCSIIEVQSPRKPFLFHVIMRDDAKTKKEHKMAYQKNGEINCKL